MRALFPVTYTDTRAISPNSERRQNELSGIQSALKQNCNPADVVNLLNQALPKITLENRYPKLQSIELVLYARAITNGLIQSLDLNTQQLLINNMASRATPSPPVAPSKPSGKPSAKDSSNP
jgi:hypothetical protein